MTALGDGPTFGDGLAEGTDLVAAAESAVAQALAPLTGRRPDLLALFIAHPDPDTISAAGTRAMEVAGARVSIGCGAGGIIGGAHGVEGVPAVAAWAARLPGATLRPFHLLAARSEHGISVGGMAAREPDDAVAVLLADPYTFPAQGFVEQSGRALDDLPLIGGLAVGTGGPGSTRLFLDGQVHDRGAIGLVVGGDVAVRTLVSQGCRPVGPAMTVTAAEGPQLRELAGVPAYRKLEEILRSLDEGERDLVSRGLQLGVAMNEYADEHERGDFLVRGLIDADATTGAITVGDVVPVGTTVRFQVRDATGAGEDLQALTAAHRAGGRTRGALLFSCNGRGGAMFGEDDGGPGADHDPRAVRAGLEAPSVAGFFAGGEIGPVAGRNQLHGFTASVLTFGD